jgi:hypothetical protein
MFKKIQSSDKVEDIIFGAFELKLPICGGWGYSKDNAVEIVGRELPISQLQYMFATARSTIEMNLSQPEDSRYGGINVKEISRQKIDDCEKVTFEISGMLEPVYAEFIKEYKENHGKSEFDLKNHFQRRAENTILRNEEIWFKI